MPKNIQMDLFPSAGKSLMKELFVDLKLVKATIIFQESLCFQDCWDILMRLVERSSSPRLSDWKLVACFLSESTAAGVKGNPSSTPIGGFSREEAETHGGWGSKCQIKMKIFSNQVFLFATEESKANPQQNVEVQTWSWFNPVVEPLARE